MNDTYREQFLKCYDNFILQLKIIFPSEETTQILDNLLKSSNDEKVAKGQLFTSTINGEQLDLFVKSKIKVFSHKSPETQAISESLFGANFCLKNLLNNQPEEVKKVIWNNLHTICMVSELLKLEDVRDQNKINMLGKLVYVESEHKQRLQEMLGVNVNEQTTEMIDDIVQSFEKLLTGQVNGANPLSGIMEISQKISVKYADKINSGEIELDKIMESITKKIPGMDQMMGGMLGSNSKKKPKEKIIIDENFSTASVEVGLNKEEESKSFNISNILKMADQFGVIPGGKQSDELPDMEGIPGLGKVFELMQKLDNADSKEDAEVLKQEMDSFLQQELGIDVEKLNAQLDEVTKQMREKEELN